MHFLFYTLKSSTYHLILQYSVAFNSQKIRMSEMLKKRITVLSVNWFFFLCNSQFLRSSFVFYGRLQTSLSKWVVKKIKFFTYFCSSQKKTYIYWTLQNFYSNYFFSNLLFRASYFFSHFISNFHFLFCCPHSPKNSLILVDG